MIVPFQPLPGQPSDQPRPVVSIHVEGFDLGLLPCLVDTGTFANRFGRWIAEWCGIDLTGIDDVALGVGGRVVAARTVPVRLRLGEWSWEAPVSFCDPWPFDYQLLGQEGFFRWFDVRIRAADRELEINPA